VKSDLFLPAFADRWWTSEGPSLLEIRWPVACYLAELKLKPVFSFNREDGTLKDTKLNQRQHDSGSLDTLPSGLAARVVSVRGSNAISRRLMEMGIVPGAPIRVVRTAPFGDPIQVCLRNYHLALRRVEASAISVLIGI
jgi:ferrous iron transport protein A